MLEKKDFLFDKRLAERFIRRGQLSRQEYNAYLSSLADVADKAEPITPPGAEPTNEAKSVETTS